MRREDRKKKLWVQGLMMGPEAMADSVATPVKTLSKRPNLVNHVKDDGSLQRSEVYL